MYFSRFRPLPGDLISQLELFIYLWEFSRVSVPFPGILFLNNREYDKESAEPQSFRPLPGDLISQD